MSTEIVLTAPPCRAPSDPSSSDHPSSEKRIRRRGANPGIHASPPTPAPETPQIPHGDKKRKRDVPKVGEEGFMSKTQLRNKRKRNCDKQVKAQALLPETAPSNKKKAKRGKKANKDKKVTAKKNTDPSQKYITSPLSCPRVNTATTFFKLTGGKLPLPSFPLYVGPLTGWRTHCKLAVRKSKAGGCVIGLFEEGSHSIDVNSSQSDAHHPLINLSIPLISKLCDENSVVPYDEISGEGELKYVVVNVARDLDDGNGEINKLQLTLISNTDNQVTPDSITNLTKGIIKLSSSDDKNKKMPIHSLFVHYNKIWKHSNAIFNFDANSWNKLYGPETVEETVDLTSSSKSEPLSGSDIKAANAYPKVRLNFSPNVFRQANLKGFGKIIVSVRSMLSNKLTSLNLQTFPKCVELYGGVGTIGLNVLDMFDSLICSDENPNNLSCFNKSKEGLPKALRKKVGYLQLSAEGVCDSGALDKAVDVVIVDPPRKGIEPSTLAKLCEKGDGRLKLLVYVSCGFDAFQRDSVVLRDQGGWKCTQGEGHCLFPGADHLEVLGVFER